MKARLAEMQRMGYAVVCMALFLMLVNANGDWGNFEMGVGKSDGRFNRVVKLLLASYRE